TRLNSIKHLSICGKQVANNSVNYFPNVTQLTIEHYFKTSDDLILLKLNLLKLDSSPLDEILIISIETKYLKTSMKRTEIEDIIRFLLIKPNDQNSKLFLKCISKTYRMCLEEINILIESEILLDNYFIKYVDDDDLFIRW
ncbi:unnamed protein product, partial [Rotaria sordida]